MGKKAVADLKDGKESTLAQAGKDEKVVTQAEESEAAALDNADEDIKALATGGKILRGKSRRHVLMKMLVSREADEMIAAMTDLAGRPFDNAEVWFEVNPTTMI